ncbi:MAG: four helix bundle protein [Nitrospirae bacterium]|nr:four helix bundle protein [Nitrospirota bacterium]
MFDRGSVDIRRLSYSFALEIIELYKYLTSKNEFIMSKQILRSGTSIGANVEESQAGQTKKDFITKMSISAKEARETHYWINLLKDSGYLDDYKNSVN